MLLPTGSEFYYDRIETFEIGQDIELDDIGVVTLVGVGGEVWVGVSPFLGGHAEDGDIKQICFFGIDQPIAAALDLQFGGSFQSMGTCLWNSYPSSFFW